MGTIGINMHFIILQDIKILTVRSNDIHFLKIRYSFSDIRKFLHYFDFYYNYYVKENNTRKKVGIGLLASLTSISLLLGSLFDSAQELKKEYPKTSKAVIESIDDYSKDDLEENEKADFKQKIKNLIYRIPVKIRTVFFVPLWGLGNVLIYMFNLTFQTLIAPILHLLLSFVIQTLILLLVIGICIKILFPDLPWSKIFSRKMIIAVIIGSIFMSLCDFIIPYFWKDYTFYRNLARFILGLLIGTIILKPFIKKKFEHPISYEIVYDDI